MKNTKRVISWILVLAMLLTNVDYVRAANITNQASTNGMQEILDDVSADPVTDGDAEEGDVSEGDMPEKDVTEGDVSDGDVPEEDVTEGDVSEGDMPIVDVTQGDVTEGDVSEGDVSKGDIPDLGMGVRGTDSGITWTIDSDGVLTISGRQEKNTEVRSDYNWRSYASKIRKVVVTAEDVTFMGSWFADLEKATSFDFSEFNTSKVTSMAYLFEGCTSVEELDLSNFDTRNVTYMSRMFSGCKNLKKINLSSFNTSKVTDMSDMFYFCRSLTRLDLGIFNTANVTDMSNMFDGCSGLTYLNVSKFDTSKVTNMYDMFFNCSSLTRLDVSKWKTPQVTNMEYMFGDCKNLTSLDLSNFSGAEDMDYMFNNCWSLKKITLPQGDNSKVKSMRSMFASCSSLIAINMNGFETANVEDISSMFHGCTGARNIDITGLNTSNITDMSYLFSGCSGATYIYLSGIDTSKVTTMGGMFAGCSSLRTANLSQLNTSSLTDMSWMFSGCSSLTSVNFCNAGSVTDMSGMFYGCSSLKNLDLSRLSTSNVKDMSQMFYGCENLRSVNLSSFNTSNVTDMSRMFYGCADLRSLDLSSFNASNLTEATDMLYCYKKCSYDYGSKCCEKCRENEKCNATCCDKCDAELPSITQIKAMRNLQIDVELPVQPMYGNSGNISVKYEKYLPKGLSEGKWLTTSASGIEYSHTICITVCDSRSKNPIPNVTVNFDGVNYITNADGIVQLYTNKTYLPKASFSKPEYISAEKSFSTELEEATVYLQRQKPLEVCKPEAKAEVPLKCSFGFDGEELTWLDTKMKLDLFESDTKIPVSYRYNKEDNTYEYIIGVKQTLESEEGEDTYQTIRELCSDFDGKTPSNNLQDYMKKNCKPSSATWGAQGDFSLMGYLKYNPETKQLVESSIVFAIEIEGTLTWRPAIGAGIFYAKATLILNCEGKLVAKIEGERVNYEATLDFGLGVGIAAGAGCDLLHGELGAQVVLHSILKIPYSDPEEHLEVRLKGKVYFEAVAFVFEQKKEWDLFDVELYPDLDFGELSSNEMSTKDVPMQLMSRDYQALSDTPMGQEYSMYNIYAYSDVQMVEINDGAAGTLLAVWVADLGEKESINRTTLVYSVNSGSGWSAAQPVCETGAADFYPHLFADGNKAALTYMRMDTELPNDATAGDFAAHADLYVTVFENGAFSQPELISDSGNGIAEMCAEIAVDGDQMAVVWVENSVNDRYFSEGVNTIYLRTFDGSKWQDKQQVATKLAYINSVAVGFVDNAPNVAYVIDKDGKQSTPKDVELYVWKGKKVTRVTSDKKPDTCVQFLGDQLFWSSNGEVMQMTVGKMKSIKSTKVTGVQDMVVLQNSTNKAILFVGTDGFKSELYLSEEAGGTFGQAVAVTDKGNKISDFAAVYQDNGHVNTIYFEKEVYGDADAETQTPGVASVKTQDTQTSTIYGATNMHVCEDLVAHNLTLTDAWYSMGELTDDNKLPVKVELYNASSEALSSVTVSLEADGQAFYTETVACEMEPNDLREVTIYWPMSTAQMGQNIVVKAVPATFTDNNLADNTKNITFGYADIVLKDFAVEKQDGASVITGTVVNEGYQAAENVAFRVLEGGQNGTELYSVSCGDMAVGAEYDISYTIPAEKLEFESAFEVKHFYVVTEAEDGEEFYGNNSEIMPVFPVRVTGLTLETEELEMSVGSTHKLTATIAPAEAINKNLYFSSNKHEVAVVLEDGTIIACAAGTAEITVLTGDGGFTGTCTVTVTAPEEGAVNYTMNTRWASIEKDSTLQLSVLDAEQNEVSGINWSSADETVATVDENGLVTAKKVGATYIICSNADNTYNNVAIIHVTGTELQSLVFDESTLDLLEGDIYGQQPVYYPENTTTDMTLSWTSSDEAVATVDAEGNVTAVAGGSATITATAVNGVSASYEVTVTALPRYTVTFDACTGDDLIEITGILGGNTVTLPETPVRENYAFMGWFTEEEGQGEPFTAETEVYENLYLYACWEYVDQTPEGLWATDVAPQTYTGKAIKPAVQVYDGHTLLEEKKDYTISYKNNVNANDASNQKKAPTITIKGKGNYTGTETITFQILKKDLAEEDVTVNELVAAASNKVQKPVPVLTYNGKKLKNKTDFTVTYPDLNNPELTDAYKKAGTYTIHVEGKGNYEGSRDLTFTIVDAVMMSKTKIASIPKQAYTGAPIEPEIKVTYKGKTLVKDTDYTVTYKNNTKVGKATVIVTGMGDYAGTKEATFTITGISIAKAKITGVVDKTYSGEACTQDTIQVFLGEKELSAEDYTVSYQKNVNVGKATMVITGQGTYTGTVKKTFKITPRDITVDSTCMWSDTMEYTKGGTLNNVSLEVDGVTLTEKKDYTISYANNKKVTKEGDKKLPTITIKGKGNYKGSIQKTYTIVPKDLSLSQDPVTITAADVPYSSKAGKYMSKPVLVDVNGKKLAAGTDYEKTFTYTLEDGTVLDPKKDAPSAGTIIKVTVTGKGGYTGTAETTYRIGTKAFKSAKIKVGAQVYTGNAITLDSTDIKVTMGKETLTYGTDYVIVEESYKNNVKKGTASVTIKGVGNYAGEKTVKFKITSKKFVWFWNLF